MPVAGIGSWRPSTEPPELQAAQLHGVRGLHRPYNLRAMTERVALGSLDLHELTSQLASGDPVPGGGSAAALGGALAAALVGMVAELTLGRPAYSAHQDAVEAVRDRAAELRTQLLELAEADAVAYQRVAAARRLPKGSDAERTARSATLGIAMLDAASVPLSTARAAREVLGLALRIAPIGNRNAVSDAGVAGLLAAAAVRGAVLNVRINLPYLPASEPLARDAAVEIALLDDVARHQQDEVLAAVDLQLRAEA